LRQVGLLPRKFIGVLEVLSSAKSTE